MARKSRPYRLRPKPSVRIPVTETKRFVRGETVLCTLCLQNAVSKATMNASITDIAPGHFAKRYKYLLFHARGHLVR